MKHSLIHHLTDTKRDEKVDNIQYTAGNSPDGYRDCNHFQMKNKLFVYCLLFTVYCFTSCSSNSDEKKTEEAHTSLHGLAGVIEKNPPVQQGDYITKYPSGIVKMRGFYINGKRNGQWTSFFENGKIQSQGFFKDGLRDGKATVYYENEKVYYEGHYKDGKEVGKWIFYDEDGKKINEKDYDGEPNS